MHDRLLERSIPEVPEPDEALIYRTEVMAIIGAFSDLLVYVRDIRDLLESGDGQEEEEDNTGS